MKKEIIGQGEVEADGVSRGSTFGEKKEGGRTGQEGGGEKKKKKTVLFQKHHIIQQKKKKMRTERMPPNIMCNKKI